MFEIEILVPIYDVEAGVRVAFGGEQFAVVSQVLLKYGDLECLPERLALAVRQSKLARIAKDHNGVLYPPSSAGDSQHLLERPGHGGA